MSYARGYVAELQHTLVDLPVELLDQVISLLHQARLERRLIFIMGNGGSASTASHFAADLSKNTRRAGWPDFRVIGLADNMALLSAYANDEGYENAFVQQLASFVQPGDVVIAISASGNSPNVLRAVDLANQVGAVTIGFTGFSGGQLGALVDYHLNVPSNVIEQVEDIHLMFEHIIVRALREHAAELPSPAVTGNLITQGGEMSVVSLSERPNFEAVYSAVKELDGNLTTTDLLFRALELSLKNIGGESGSIVWLNEQGEVVNAALAYGGKLESLNSRQLSDIIKYGLAGWVIENRQAALVANTRKDPRWLPRTWEKANGVTRSAVSTPLLERDRVTGVLTRVQPQAGKFNQDHLVLLAAIAISVSLKVEKVSVEEFVERRY